jgi:hypothetical protein
LTCQPTQSCESRTVADYFTPVRSATDWVPLRKAAPEVLFLCTAHFVVTQFPIANLIVARDASLERICQIGRCGLTVARCFAEQRGKRCVLIGRPSSTPVPQYRELIVLLPRLSQTCIGETEEGDSTATFFGQPLRCGRSVSSAFVAALDVVL